MVPAGANRDRVWLLGTALTTIIKNKFKNGCPRYGLLYGAQPRTLSPLFKALASRHSRHTASIYIFGKNIVDMCG